MPDSTVGGHLKSDRPTDEPRLESWGEIAAYLHREIRTVQRWERYQGLPVRRLQIGKLGTVYAYRSELDKWFRERQPAAENGELAAVVTVLPDTDPSESKDDSSHSMPPPPRPR